MKTEFYNNRFQAMNKLIFPLLIFGNLFAQQNKLTLEESVEIGLINSKLIKISESKVRSADARVTEFTSQMLPKISFGAGYNYLNLTKPSKIAFGPAPINVINPFSSYNLSLNIQLPIFTGFT